MSIEGSETSKKGVASIDAATNCAAAPINLQYAISDLAVEYGVTLRALRFYESKGLLKPRRDGAARLYSEDDRRRLKLIIKGKQLGFTLREIIDLVARSTDVSTPNELGLTRQQCIEQIKLLERQKREIEGAILELRRTYSSLCKRETAGNPAHWSRSAAADRTSRAG
jgi:DNA-binding transcriptional MerR regulator